MTPRTAHGARRARAAFPIAILLALAAGWAATGCDRGGGSDRAEARSVGPYRVSVANRPARPVVGDNTLAILVRDEAGRPVGGAAVEAMVSMPAMGTMPRMESRGTVKETEPGRYEARYGLSMSGEWNVNISIQAPGASKAAAEYRLSTSTPDLLFQSGTPPAGGAPDEAATEPGPGGAGGHAGHGVSGAAALDLDRAVALDAARRREIGVRTEAVGTRRLRVPIRAAGTVAYDETRRAEISLKFSGWVREIHVDYTGKHVRAGDPLFSVYSPELLAAQQEFLESRRAPAGGGSDTAAADSGLAAAARQRLLLWDIGPAQIDAIARAGVPKEEVPILAPAGGVVVEKNVVRGSAFTAGQMLYKIAPVDPVWVVASVYQYELPLVREGMAATVETPFLARTSHGGRVAYVNPYLDPATRTAEVRLEIPNPSGELKPGMFVDVLLTRDLGERLAVPEQAVLYEGDRRVVFVDLGDGRFAPREVELGAKAGDVYEVRAGLRAGDVVVTSGNFLIAAESRLRAAASK